MSLFHKNLPTDEALWKQLLEGNEDALDGLMQRYFRELFHYGGKFSRDDDLIKDCIQDLFLDIWERRQTLRPDVFVKPYLLVALRRRIHRVWQMNQLQTDLTTIPDFAADFTVEEHLILSEQTRFIARQMQQLLDALPARQKEVIYLRYFQELNREQIADVMHITLQSVSNLLQEALRKLRGQWKTDL
ncbi:MAG: sigma-70 family RNA polymerase sigma factor [Cytophagaceae bacterium]|nr:MAG: sigma-70 family RNA polymerase sigma factor [Cytophagaceae bacterium]